MSDKANKIIAIISALVIFFTGVQFVRGQDGNANLDINKRLAGAIVLYIDSPLALVDNVQQQIDAENNQVRPVILKDRTLVPARFIAQSLKGQVDWNNNTSTVTITLSGKRVKLKIGSSEMEVGGSLITLDTPAQVLNGRTFIPLRQLVEALGKKVFYDRGLIVISDKEDAFDAKKERAILDDIISKVNIPPVVGTKARLQELLKNAEAASNARDGSLYGFDIKEGNFFGDTTFTVTEQVSNKAKADIKAYSDYSKTNVQVEGVDEADVVKTDGQYIYQVNNQKIVIAKANPPQKMEIMSITKYEGSDFYPSEMYIDKDKMIVIGTSNNQIQIPYKGAANSKLICPPPYQIGTVKVIIYDIGDKANIKKLREVELEGSYITSRRIGSNLYVISNKYLWSWSDIYYTKQSVKSTTPTEPVEYDEVAYEKYSELVMNPSYRDTAQNKDFLQIDYSKQYYFPDSVQSNYVIIGAINLDNMDEKANITAYLGAGENVYASLENLYITFNKYNQEPVLKPGSMRVLPRYSDINTQVYKFSLQGGKVTYLAKGEVPGTLLNQFSMDESGKYFRAATTKGNVWGSGEGASSNNVYVLDETLNTVGRLEDMARGEKIYSVRFMGERAYVVTFKTVDPLFVIDLKDAKNPKVLGALKIPGYSDYLHPYDENHIIGFGKDTTEVKGGAYYMGMKLAIFDVSDVANPKQMFTEYIGDRGTDSELLTNHKALLFSKEKGLLAFPVTLMEVKGENNDKSSFPEYGQFTYQGAYIYNIDLVKGFTLKGRITHITEDEYKKSGNDWYYGDRSVERILYIDKTLYTLSKAAIKANAMEDLKEIQNLEIP